MADMSADRVWARSGHRGARLVDHCLRRVCVMQPQIGDSLLKRKLNSAVHTRCGELEIDHSSELVWHELAY